MARIFLASFTEISISCLWNPILCPALKHGYRDIDANINNTINQIKLTKSMSFTGKANCINKTTLSYIQLNKNQSYINSESDSSN